ncbi:MAG TPA: PQQ-binding-like beta-propeller repeat protein [Bryobacteraceae bacterium]|nr:PQQ-binding-like beta-propeller repeat protein [Bryobacteraceae bacterium]
MTTQKASTLTCLALAASALQAQTPVAEGRKVFESRCSVCHGADGNGGEMGPAIARRIPNLPDPQIKTTILDGLPERGMPAAANLKDTELAPLIAFLHTLRPSRSGLGFQSYPAKIELTGQGALEGTIISEAFDEAALRTADGRIHLLRKLSGGKYREVTSKAGWPSYNGDIGGNRFTRATQIDKSNVTRVAPRWMFTLPNSSGSQTTPLVVEGVMYVAASNECYALDAGTGHPIWHYQRPRTRGLTGGGASGANRGLGYANRRIFMNTDNAHLIALDPSNGELLWDSVVADSHLNYSASSAPLAVNNLVVTGSAGGEEGARGFIAAFDQTTGKEVWRFWTVPAPGEPGSETWKGKGIEHGGAVAWFTGSYDASTDTVFWQAGNPGEDYNGDDRLGDNLYSDSILALDAKTGKLKWHYQTTPHDLWDWDTTETMLVVDANWEGRPRKLLVQGNRNGFFYVFDRSDGKLLLAKQFINDLTWAKGIGPDGRPILVSGQEPSAAGTHVCPSQDGATNWYSPSFNPALNLFFMQTNEKCSVYTKRGDEFALGRDFLGGAQKVDAQPKPKRILRALDLQTGKVKWEVPQIGTADSWGGTLATASGLVFYGEDSGAFVAADAATGKTLWTLHLNANWHASPMAYDFDGKELIGVVVGPNVMVLGLVD